MRMLFEQAAVVLQKAAEAMHLLRAKEPDLKNAAIETWRHDEPVATISWIADDGINRNITCFIEGQCVRVEANVWRDKDSSRCYGNLKCATLPLKGIDFCDSIEHAYIAVNRISNIDITPLYR